MVSYVVSVRFISGFVFGAGSGIAALKLYLYEEEKTDTGNTSSLVTNTIKTSSLVTNTALINKHTGHTSIVHVLSCDRGKLSHRYSVQEPTLNSSGHLHSLLARKNNDYLFYLVI